MIMFIVFSLFACLSFLLLFASMFIVLHPGDLSLAVGCFPSEIDRGLLLAASRGPRRKTIVCV